MNRTTLLTAAAALALLAGPALAQQQPSGATGQSGSGQQQAGGSSSMQAMSQDKLRSSLEKAGFKNVNVVDATYLVRAQDSDGNQVMMFVNPPSMSASGGSSGQSGSGQTSGSSGGQSGSGQSKGSSGN